MIDIEILIVKRFCLAYIKAIRSQRIRSETTVFWFLCLYVLYLCLYMYQI